MSGFRAFLPTAAIKKDLINHVAQKADIAPQMQICTATEGTGVSAC
jgi:hypothetical protein